MKPDAVVVGAELEVFVAALRLAEGGARVQLLMPDGGGLRHAPGGLALLAPVALGEAAWAADPFSLIAALDEAHPLRVIGEARTRAAIAWFMERMAAAGCGWSTTGANVAALTMTGRPVPLFACPGTLATMPHIGRGPLAVVQIDGFRDISVHLLLAALRERGLEATALPISLSPECGDSVQFALALEAEPMAAALIDMLRPAVSDGIATILFPALLGVEGHATLVHRLEEALGAVVLEVPTLPPSVPGLRLFRGLVHRLRALGADIRSDVRGLRSDVHGACCRRLVDGEGRDYAADAYLLGTGGVMAGGLEVDSRGMVREPILDARVHQTAPLGQRGAEAVADALHRAGVVADGRFRIATAAGLVGNAYALGGLQAHWNPVAERSAEGVAIATAVAAADGALAALRQAR